MESQGPKTVITRVQSSALFSNVYLLDPLESPPSADQFRKSTKAKWKGRVINKQQDFMKFIHSNTNTLSKFTPLNIDDIYIDGYEVIGDVSRKRNKKLEIAGDFKPNNSKDVWNKLFKPFVSNCNFSSKSQLKAATSAKKLYPNSMKERGKINF